jgi:hypothetical protein
MGGGNPLSPGKTIVDNIKIDRNLSNQAAHDQKPVSKKPALHKLSPLPSVIAIDYGLKLCYSERARHGTELSSQ